MYYINEFKELYDLDIEYILEKIPNFIIEIRKMVHLDFESIKLLNENVKIKNYQFAANVPKRIKFYSLKLYYFLS